MKFPPRFLTQHSLLALVAVLALLAACAGNGGAGSDGETTPETATDPDAAAEDPAEEESPEEAREDEQAASGEPIRIGILLPQSGNAAVTGRFMTDGYVAAIEEINANGGIAGRPIEHEIFDTVGDPQNGVNAFNRFLAGDYHFGLIGFSAVVTAVAPISEGEDVLLVNSGAPPFNPDAMGAHTIHTLNGQDHEMRCAAQYAYNELGARKAGFIYADIAANFEGVQKFAAAFQEAGGEVAGFEGAEQGSPDFRSLLTRLNQQSPDLIYIYTFGPDPGNIMKQMQELGMDAMKMGYSGAVVPQTVEVGGTAAEGFVATIGLFDASSDDPHTQQFLESRKEFINQNDDPAALGFYHATTYDGMEMLATAMEHVAESGGDMEDPRQVQDAFYEVGTFEVATGTAVYEEGNPVPEKPFQVQQVTDGKFTPIDVIQEC